MDPGPVRDISCSTPASWLASAALLVCALRFPDSPSAATPLQHHGRVPEVSTPRRGGLLSSSNAVAAVAARYLRRLNWRWRVQPHRTWDSLVCAADSCWLAWSSCWLTLSNWW
jgi:hypothetical protein